MKYEVGMRAELKVDCYGGESCEEHERHWWMYAEGDRDSDRSADPLVLDIKYFPPGTKVTVEFPVCPDCGLHAGHDADTCDCGFDWKNWVEEQYA